MVASLNAGACVAMSCAADVVSVVDSIYLTQVAEISSGTLALTKGKGGCRFQPATLPARSKPTLTRRSEVAPRFGVWPASNYTIAAREEFALQTQHLK